MAKLKKVMGCGCIIGVDYDEQAVFIVYCRKHGAAPDMYEALKLLLERFESMNEKYSYPMALDLPRVWAEKALAKVENKV